MFEQIIMKIKEVFIPCDGNGYKPKILAGNFLVYFFIGLIALKIISLGFLFEFPKNSFFADVSKTILIKLLNSQRDELGLSQLVENPNLSYAAELKAKDMMDNDYFSHNSPQGTTAWYWFQVAGYNYHYAGENLGIGFVDSEEIHNAWNSSPLHKENLLNANYNEIGIAILQGEFNGVENTIVVQLFGRQFQPVAAPARSIQNLEKKAVSQPESAELPAPVAITEPEAVEPEAAAVTKPVNTSAGSEYFSAGSARVAAGAEIASFQGAIGEEFADTANESIKFKFFRFMAMHYHNLLQGLIFYSLIFVSLILMVNVFVKTNIQHKGLTIKTLSLIFLLVLSVYINKDIMLKFIPHVVNVY